MLNLFTIGILILLVGSGLNISIRAVNSLTMDNQGPLLAIHFDRDAASIEALGHTYTVDQGLLHNGQTGLQKAVTRCGLYTREVCNNSGQKWHEAKAVVQKWFRSI